MIPAVLNLPRLVRLAKIARERRRLAQSPDLTYLFWECTHRCNLMCGHCGSSCGPSVRPPEELETREVKRIFSEIAQDFDASRIFVSITGGEPLVREDLDEIVAHMVSLGMTVCMVSNGTLLTPERARRLVHAGMGVLSVSIDGLKDTHEVIRGPNTYERALEGLANARAAGFYDTEAITCVRPRNLPQLPEIEKAVRAAGCNLWRLITIDAMGRAGEPDDPACGACPSEEALDQNANQNQQVPPVIDSLWLDPQGCRDLLAFLKRRRRELEQSGEDFAVQFSCGGFLGVREEDVRPVQGFGGQCAAGLVVASVLYDGAISACPSLPRDLIQGDARKERFSEVWRSKFKVHRDFDARRVGPCQGCAWFELCLGGGLHERLAQPDDFCWIKRTSGSLP